MDNQIFIIFRNDDLCALSDPVRERRILEIFEKYGIPQVFGSSGSREDLLSCGE